jgi:precorrin-6Y C5,15-methyltransferase (decarboxylating)
MVILYVIGVGYRPFDPRTEEIIGSSTVILASQRLFDLFMLHDVHRKVKDRVMVLNNVDQTMEFLKEEIAKQKARRSVQRGEAPSAPITLLASGDPLFHGIGRRVLAEFGRETVEIIPDLSSIQIAFARVKESWDDAVLISLHGGPDPAKRRRLPYELSDVPFLVARYKKVAILTDQVNSPSVIARELLASPELSAHPSSVMIHVCERLGHRDERIWKGSPTEVSRMSFSDPNVMIVMYDLSARLSPVVSAETSHMPGFWTGGSETRFGLKEDDIVHTKGLITKDEARAVSIHKLRLPTGGVFWDIGAGSGSVSVEVARMFPDMRVYAVEKDEAQIANIRENRIRFNAPSVEIVAGIAPDALRKLPSPHSVFVGGTGGRLEEIIGFVADLPTFTVVVNATKLETLHVAVSALRKADFVVDVAHLAVSRMRSIGEGHSLSAVNPVFIIRGAR